MLWGLSNSLVWLRSNVALINSAARLGMGRGDLFYNRVMFTWDLRKVVIPESPFKLVCTIKQSLLVIYLLAGPNLVDVLLEGSQWGLMEACCALLGMPPLSPLFVECRQRKFCVVAGSRNGFRNGCLTQRREG